MNVRRLQVHVPNRDHEHLRTSVEEVEEGC